ncbi:hypothetical protein ACFS7Z_06315 [Pontibacter toksunensis]|uniref:Uncharacterized protein n=1 Tax=Pontibacter toksunensis TaxID=1332631 RepID=A0ABW6BRT1_9BACT
MYKISTSDKSDLTLLAVLFFLLLLFSSCTARVEKEVQGHQKTTEAVAAEEAAAVTVAAFNNTSDEVYFDFIAKTSGCLGEDVWLGGKLESKRKVMLSNSGAIFPVKEYQVTELTAVGLSTNNNYAVQDEEQIMKGVSRGNGVIHLQLTEGELELLSPSNTDPVVLAYEPIIMSKKIAGTWSCPQ